MFVVPPLLNSRYKFPQGCTPLKVSNGAFTLDVKSVLNENLGGIILGGTPGAQFFLLGRVRGVGFFLKFLVVLTRFPSCSSDSQCVPQHVCQVPCK